MMCNILLKCALVTCLMLTASITSTVTAQEGDEPKYTITDGKVDKGTYNGWRRFHATCYTCHGQDALGSSFAPNLTESLQTLTYPSFIETVYYGRQTTGGATGPAVMPAFVKDPNIANHIDDIYRYLTARAKGGLPPGRPKK